MLLIDGPSAPSANWQFQITSERWEDVKRAVPAFLRGATR